MTQQEDTTIDDLYAKAACRMIVYRLYQDDDDDAFNEVSSSIPLKHMLSGLHELSVAQDNL